MLTTVTRSHLTFDPHLVQYDDGTIEVIRWDRWSFQVRPKLVFYPL